MHELKKGCIWLSLYKHMCNKGGSRFSYRELYLGVKGL